MTSNSDKLRSLILAALMVFSVFAGTVALSGSAAAVGNNDVSFDTLQPTSVEDSAGEVTHAYSISVNNVDTSGDVTVTLTAPVGDVVDSDTSVTVTDGNGDPVPATVQNDDSTDSTATIDIAQSDLTTSDYTIAGDFVVDYSDAPDGVTGTVDAQVSDNTGSDTASSTTVDVGSTALSSGGSFYAGQSVSVDVSSLNSTAASPNGEYRVFDVNADDNPGSLQRLVTVESGSISFDLDGRLSEGDFVVVNDEEQPLRINSNGVATVVDKNNNNQNGEDYADSEAFSVVSQDLTAEFDDASVGNDGGEAEVDFEIDSDVRSTYQVNVSAQGDLDVEELTDIFNGPSDSSWTVVTEYDDEDTITVRAVGSSTAEADQTLDFDEIDSGTYTFETNVTDTTASDTDEIEVTDTGDESASFADNVYTDQRGDVVNMTIEMENTDTATVQVGEDDSDGVEFAANITDDDEDGVAYVEFNSFVAGDTSVSSDAILTAGDDDTVIDDRNNNAGSFSTDKGSNVLEAGDYTLYAASERHKYLESGDADARGTLSLSEVSVNNLQVWQLPEDAESDLASADAEDVSDFVQAGNLTQTDNIAEGDTTVVQVEASGFEGAFEDNYGSNNVDSYQSLADVTTGNNQGYDNGGDAPFSFRFETSTGLNTGSGGIGINDLDAENLSVLYDGDANAHYIVINSDSITSQVAHEDGDDYVANFTVYESNTDYVNEGTSVTQEFSIEDPEIELNANADDEIVLQAGPGQEVTGDTNLAPGTTVETTLDSDTSGDPFVKRPETTVQADGTFTAVADFSDNNAGSNFTAEALAPDFSGALDESSDEYNGRLVEFTGEPVTSTPDTSTPDTSTPDTSTPDTSTPDTSTDTATAAGTDAADGGDATETATGGSGPGFTAALALIALVAAALLAVRRNN